MNSSSLHGDFTCDHGTNAACLTPGDGTEARSGMWTHERHQQLRIDAHGIPRCRIRCQTRAFIYGWFRWLTDVSSHGVSAGSQIVRRDSPARTVLIGVNG